MHKAGLVDMLGGKYPAIAEFSGGGKGAAGRAGSCLRTFAGTVLPSMKPIAITFDCAKTLLEGEWNPVSHAFGCLQDVGVADFDRVAGVRHYQALLKARYPNYPVLNETRDPAACRAFWVHLTEAWLRTIDLDPDLTPAIMAASDARFYATTGGIWRPYDDVLPTLNALRARGYRLAVISNWDISLDLLLVRHGLRDYFEVVLASLVEGVEKPDPRLFRIALSHLELGPESVIHVGDNPEDDVAGAEEAGILPFLIDRTPGATPGEGLLTDLRQLLEVVE